MNLILNSIILILYIWVMSMQIYLSLIFKKFKFKTQIFKMKLIYNKKCQISKTSNKTLIII